MSVWANEDGGGAAQVGESQQQEQQQQQRFLQQGGSGAASPVASKNLVTAQREARLQAAAAAALSVAASFPSPSFDYSLSTEQNYAVLPSPTHAPSSSSSAASSSDEGRRSGGEEVGEMFVGKYKAQRAKLDYSFHSHYTVERQLLHDMLIDLFHDTIVHDTENNMYCDRPKENWIVFTAGPMGAGKGHTMQWLSSQNLFPLTAFVKVDPDSLRELLPETKEYIRRDPSNAGRLTQKEVGYISEVLSMDALQQGKNVLVDGSLRDAVWYSFYISSLREQFPKLKIAIIEVRAKEETVLARARRRGEDTGRIVPEEILIETMKQMPESMKLLKPKVDFVATFENEEGSAEPRLVYSSKSLSTNNLTKLLDEAVLAESRINDGGGDGGGVGGGGGGGGGMAKDEVSFSPDEDWKESFRAVWKMTCALPTFTSEAATSSASAKPIASTKQALPLSFGKDGGVAVGGGGGGGAAGGECVCVAAARDECVDLE